MGMILREIKEDEYDLLQDFLYEAIFIPEGVEPPARDIIRLPELKLYYEGFGKGKADHCIVADDDGRVVGAVWTRIMNDYGHVDDDTPSFAISLYKEYRGKGIGTKLMEQMLELLKEKHMKYKAVVFDLFETLITEWGHEKYTKKAMCADLGVEKEEFDVYWEEKEQDRYLGSISFEESILYACEKCKKQIDTSLLNYITEKRVKTKSECFKYVLPDVYRLLQVIREMGLKTAIVSNCSSEEVQIFRESEISKYFDAAVLSFEVHMKKPDVCIYEEASKRLGIDMSECLFVGDGGSNELVGARNAGMKAVQAKWYTDQHPVKRENIEGFRAAEEPMDIIAAIRDME